MTLSREQVLADQTEGQAPLQAAAFFIAAVAFALLEYQYLPTMDAVFPSGFLVTTEHALVLASCET